MTASNTPKPGDDRAPDEHADATTEILAGLTDPDRTPTEVIGPDADHTPTEKLADADRTTKVLDDSPDRTATERLADGDRTTKVLPEASAHSTRVPPKPKASDPTTRVLPGAAPAASAARVASAPPAAPSAGAAPGHASAPAAAAGGPESALAPQTSGGPGAAPRASATTPPTPPPAAVPAAGRALPPHGSADASPRYPRPHVRWAGIIWGLVFAVSAALLLWVLAEPARRDAVGDWWASLTPIGFALTALLVAGGLLLIGGVAGLARRLAHRRA